MINFEMYTYQYLLADALSWVPNTMDKREGSIIYDAISPACYELAFAYTVLKQVYGNLSLATAVGNALTELCSQSGTFRKLATPAIREAEFNIDVPIGSRFSGGGLVYVATEKISVGLFKLTCETTGDVGNTYTGNLIPIDYISGLTSSVMTSVITEGMDEETDADLRERHRIRIIDGTQSGNAAQYTSWALAYTGIGACKLFPLWDGGNTVKIAIANNSKQVASAQLVAEFQDYMDPDSEGLGNGVAPIGSKVTITGGTAKNINVAGNVTLNEGYIEPTGAEDAVVNYLASITYNQDEVSYIQVAVAILNCDSIKNLTGFTLNSAALDIALVNDEIPTLAGFSLTVVTP